MLQTDLVSFNPSTITGKGIDAVGGAVGGEAPLGNTTKFADKSTSIPATKPEANQRHKQVVCPETGETFSYTYCDRLQKWLQTWDQEEALLERWMLLQYSQLFLSRPEYWETREKMYSVPYTDLTSKVLYTCLETGERCSVLSHEIGLPVQRMKRNSWDYPEFTDLDSGEVLTAAHFNRAPVHRVVLCHRQQLPGTLPELRKNVESDSVSWGSVGVCGSVWTCPVCSAKINRHRREEIKSAYNACSSVGGSAYLLTFTVKHGIGDDLQTLLERMKNAMRHIQKSHAWKEVTRQKALKRPQANSLPFLGHIGRISALEVTHGKNGWHPHEHQLWFFRKDLTRSELSAVRDRLFEAWKTACLASGLPAPRKYHTDKSGRRRLVALDIRKALSAEEYLTKYGSEHLDGSSRVRRWGPEKEIASAHLKKATRGGATPFELLYQGSQGCKASRERFVEFANAFKGLHQLQFSRRLKAFVEEVSDLSIDDSAEGDEVLALEQGDSILLKQLTPKEFKQIVDCRAQGLVLAYVRAHGVADLLDFIWRLRPA